MMINNEADALREARGLGFVAGVLERQQHELLCKHCKGFAKTLEVTRERLQALEASKYKASLGAGWQEVLKSAARTIEAVPMPGEPVPQRKLGNCKLKDGKCFVKYARRFALPDPEEAGKSHH